MKNSFADKNLRIAIADPDAKVRQVIATALRNLGYFNIVMADHWRHLTCNHPARPDWFITSSFDGHEHPTLHLLNILREEDDPLGAKVTLLSSGDEALSVAEAYRLGLLSSLPRCSEVELFQKDLQNFLRVTQQNHGNTCLVAAHYLTEHLKYLKQYDVIIGLHKNLLRRFPGAITLMLKLSEVFALKGNFDSANKLLKDILLLDDSLVLETKTIRQKYSLDFQSDGSEEVEDLPLLGIENCVVIEPDEAVQNYVRQGLSNLGVKRIATFTSGHEAWDWLQRNSTPELIIQEWKVPGIPGPFFIQRLREMNWSEVPIMIISSLIQEKEVPLLREFGITEVLPKPFQLKSFLKAITRVVQHAINPVDLTGIDYCYQQLLAGNRLVDAKRLQKIYLSAPSLPPGTRELCQGEMAFAQKDYRRSLQYGLESLRLASDAVRTLRLVGHSFLQVKDYARAIKFLDRALQLSPHNLRLTADLALTYLQMGESVKAQSMLEKGLHHDPRSVPLQKVAVLKNLMQNEGNEAKSILDQVENRHLFLAFVCERAFEWLAEGRYEQVERVLGRLRDLVSSKREIAGFTLNLAIATAIMGNYVKAREWLEQLPANELGEAKTKLTAALKDPTGGANPLDYFWLPCDRLQETISDKPLLFTHFCCHGMFQP